MKEKQYYIYIMTNKWHTTLYTGVTSNLIRRVFEHRNKLKDGFSKKYNLVMLVYYEVYQFSLHALEREKQIKGGSRKKKILLIEKENPFWLDLYEQF